MGKEEKKKNLFLAYFLTILGALLTIFLVCIGIMFFSPGTQILGFEYVVQDQSLQKNIKLADLLTENVKAIKIAVNSGLNVTVRPVGNSENLTINYKQQYNGFSKSINAKYIFEDQTKDKYFENQASEFKTKCILVKEPNAWSVSSNSTVEILMPDFGEYSMEVIYVESEYGEINYSATQTVEETPGKNLSFSSTNLYLQTSHNANINVLSTTNNSNYYFKTDNGSVNLNGSQNLTAKNMIFDSNTGTFNFTNSDKNATLSLQEKFYILSQNDKGPNVQINNLNAHSEFILNGGKIAIDNFASEGLEKNLIVKSNKAKFTFGNIYGNVSFSDNNGQVRNEITIKGLFDTSENKNEFVLGSGNVVIEELKAHANLTSTSGSIKVLKASKNKNIYALSNSGLIDISYEQNDGPISDKTLKVYTKTGDVILKQVPVLFQIYVLEDSPSAKLYVQLKNVPKGDCIIDSGNRCVELAMSTNESVKFRLLTEKEVTLPVGLAMKAIKAVDRDSLYDIPDYTKYKFNYRVNYEITDAGSDVPYESCGKVLVKNSSNVKIGEVE